MAKQNKKQRTRKNKRNKSKKNTVTKVHHINKDTRKNWSDRINSVLIVVGVVELPQKLYELAKFIINLF